MYKFPVKLAKRLKSRKEDNSFRELLAFPAGVDFFSNDYLGLARSTEVQAVADDILKDYSVVNGSTGSRLLSGNHELFQQAEDIIARFHNAESALIFNSGYDANLGFFSSVPQKNDLIIYDELSHASIRDGLKMNLAKSFKFRHNDIKDLERLLSKHTENAIYENIYVVTESVFSMDGDSPDLTEMANICLKFSGYLVVDEAHATGVIGARGQGLIQELELEEKVFARIQTFGKGLGCHGAAILGNDQLKDYLVNFSRSFIYTTALSPHSVVTILAAYRQLEGNKTNIEQLAENIKIFKDTIRELGLESSFIPSNSAIQSCVVGGNLRTRELGGMLQENGYAVKPILSPTVEKGKERLRFCLHSYNSSKEIKEVLKLLANFVKN
ncbi:aminotransferase class I/II-fold pyridoxal phosphate-dependent enzyme [Christiangramia aquimixticola]|uniref:aminotransferase class I/II-fold pyridoxal phosphate-dependent enzyme n=1 Tax=Christiangramia aquimixticola TaxID=1697558 RepID=UPI003AA7CDEA